MHLSTAYQWLEWFKQQQAQEVQLGLDRVKAVAAKLKLLSPAPTVITVAGTNGKGSTVAGLEGIYRACQYNVGAYTSPMLLTPHEQVRINTQPVPDQELCQAFTMIEENRGEVTLTPFEYFTLAALVIFKSHNLDVLILEVGLGGRLDAVNIIDANLAIITSIGIDHVEWLGDTREKIAYEKAGIFRQKQRAVCGDSNPPLTLLEQAEKLQMEINYLDREYRFTDRETTWQWNSTKKSILNLPKNGLLLENMATVLMAIEILQTELPVTEQRIHLGLENTKLPGRIQIIPSAIPEIHDVAHNPAAIKKLATHLLQSKAQHLAVFSMLQDKDIASSIEIIAPYIAEWFVAPLQDKRAADKKRLELEFSNLRLKNISMNYKIYDSIFSAYLQAKARAVKGDVIVVFGSFHTIAEVIRSAEGARHLKVPGT